MGLITSNATQLHRGGIAEFPSVNKLVDAAGVEPACFQLFPSHCTGLCAGLSRG